MALSKAMINALKTLSYAETDISKNYKQARALREVTQKKIIKARNTSFDYELPIDDYAPEIFDLYEFICRAADAENAGFFDRGFDKIIPRGGHSIQVRVFRPDEDIENKPVIIYLHGGGWVVGSIETYDRLCTTLAKQTDRIVLSVNYRLAPEFPFPCGLVDCAHVIYNMLDHAERFGISKSDITIAGDSAGGNLCAAASLLLRDRGDPVPDKQILIYPATYGSHDDDGPFESVRECGADYLLTSKRVREYMSLYCPLESDRYNPYLAPLEASDLSRQPQTLVLSAEFDPLRDEGEAYAKKLEAAGNHVVARRVPDSIHGYFSLPTLHAPVRYSYDVIKGFLA